MKAKAPEKIYVCEYVFLNNVDWEGSPITTKRIDDHDIEYTRTDAFIEKACEWLSKHAIKYYFGSSKFLGTDELVEDFKIAMRL